MVFVGSFPRNSVSTTVVHPPGTTVEADITRSPTGLKEPDVAITMNGRLIRRIEKDTTGPELSELPNPINVSV